MAAKGATRKAVEGFKTQDPAVQEEGKLLQEQCKEAGGRGE